jgi:hypothetical protein
MSVECWAVRSTLRFDWALGAACETTDVPAVILYVSEEDDVWRAAVSNTFNTVAKEAFVPAFELDWLTILKTQGKVG